MNPQDFHQYIDAARGEKDHIAFFLAAVSQTTTPAAAAKLSTEAIAGLYSRRGGEQGTPNSRCSYASAYRKSFKAMATDRQIAAEIVAAVVPLLKGTDDDIAATKSKQTAKSRKQMSNLTPFNPHQFLAQIEAGLNSSDWRELAAAIVAACHARPIDVLKLGEFRPLGEYQVEFVSKAKKRGGTAVGNIWVMVPSAQFIDSFERLRRMPDVVRYQTMTNKEVDSSANSNVGRGVQRIFGGVLPVPHDDDGEASASNLRAAATNVAQWLYGADEIHVAELAIRQLMHDSTNAEASYRDYRLVDDAGAAIKDYGVRRPDAGATVPYYFYSLDGKGAVKPDSVIDESKVIEINSRGHAAAKAQTTVTEKPKAMTKSSITADRLTLEELKTFPGATNAEKLQRLMAKARQVEDLERQLEYQKAQNTKLRKAMETTAAATAAEQPAAAAQTAPAPTTEATAMTTTTTAPADDIRKLEDHQIIGKKAGFAEERIRRTVAAIQDYNAGRELEEQIEINVGSIRALAAVNAAKVGEWCKANAAALTAYAEAQGHPGGKDSKFNRGKDFKALVPLAWNQAQ
jgi:hypothetical protein